MKEPMEVTAQEHEFATISIRLNKADRSLLLGLFATLADDYLRTAEEKLSVNEGQEYLKGMVLQEKRSAIWNYLDDVAVKWGIVNPFRLNPTNNVKKEENGNEEGQSSARV